ncbi:MAG TPA: hypothetical protein VGB17_04965 [Pyrinomonadaceae bacterium]
MRRILKQHWPLALALLALWLTVAAFWLILTAQTGGRFIYALDDAYIHMAMAKNFVSEGVWGVTRYEFSSSTSSVLWTLLLSAIYLLTGAREKIPFILNLVAATFALVAAYLSLKNYSITQRQRFLLLVAFIFLTSLPPLVFSGMEHCAQILIDICFVYLAARVLEDESFAFKDFASLCLLALAALLTLIRYEGLFLISIVCLLFLWRRRTAYAFALGLAAIIPIGLYGLVSVRHGAFWLPNSVLLKGALPTGGALGPLKHAYLKSIEGPHLPLLLLITLALYLFRRKRVKRLWEQGQTLLIILLVAIAEHLLFASIGWFYRYEAYLVALGVLIDGALICESLPDWSSLKQKGGRVLRPATMALSVCLLAALIPLLKRSFDALRDTPRADLSIYQQQYQMSLFLREYYQGAAVAANDIGAINYFADIRCLDLWGLGSAEITRDKLRGQYNTSRIKELAANHQVKIAVVYSGWIQEYGGVPSAWKRMGKWVTPGCIVCGSDTISFYAVDPAEAEALTQHLKEFSQRLPTGVQQGGRYLSER